MKTEQLTFTRFLAAISIVIFHFGDSFFPFNTKFFSSFVHQAYIGVSYFFVLSGFVMIIAYAKRDSYIKTKDYFKNRIARILPLYYFAMACMLVYYFIRIKILNISTIYEPTFVEGLLNTFLIQAWFLNKATSINVPAWSLSVEVIFYLLFPLMFNRVYTKVSFRTIKIIIVTFFIFSQTIFHWFVYELPAMKTFFLYHPLLHLNEFIMGNLFGLLFLRKGNTKKDNTFFVLMVVIFLLMILKYPLKGLVIHNGVYGPIFGVFIYLLAQDKGIITRFFQKKQMQFLGEVSFGIYLLQFPVFLFFTASLTLFGVNINQYLFYIYIFLLCMVSILSFMFIEKPLRTRIKKIY